MGHSIQMFRNRSAIINDVELVALICIMEDEADARSTMFPTIRPAVMRWCASLAAYGPGLIEMDLDALLSSAQCEREFLSLLSCVEERLRLFGEKVPKSLLYRCCVPGIKFDSDYDSRFVSEAIAMLKKLVSGHGGS
jgi:hypothetical protein